MLTYLTGRKAEFTTLDPATDSPESVFNRLQALQRASEPIVAGTSAGDPRTMFTRYGLVPGHASSVIGATFVCATRGARASPAAGLAW